MASWRPQTDFEHQIVSLQPEYNFIYGDLSDTQKKLQNGYHSRPAAHLNFLNKKSKDDQYEYSNGLHAIRAVKKMTGAIQPSSLEDSSDIDNRAYETVAMIRHCGMGPSEDTALNEKTTIPTLPLRKNIHVVRTGQKRFPVIFDDDHFKIESTRMRNAKLLKDLNLIEDEFNSMQIEKENSKYDENITPLNEEEVEEPTEAEIAAEEYEKFVAAYPKLEKQEVKSKTNNFPSLNEKRTSLSKQHKNRKSTKKADLNLNSSMSCNSSASSFSAYESCENYDSINSSKYYTADESRSWTPQKDQKASTNTVKSYAGVVQEKVRDKKVAAGQRQYYTPREVYAWRRNVYNN